MCSSYDYATDTWTPGVSAYDGTNFAPSTLVGGFASDNGHYENCTFRNTLAGISVESAQALDMVAQKCIFIPVGTGKSIYITACQGFSFYDTTILGETFIYVFGKSSVGNIVTYNHHIENGGNPDYVFYHDNFTPLGKGCGIQTGGGGGVVLKGVAGSPESTFYINNAILSKLQFNAAGMSAIVENSTITERDKTVGGNGKLLKLTNVYITTLTGTTWNAFDNVILESTTLPGFTALTSVPAMSGSGQYFSPDFVVGIPGSVPIVASQIFGTSFTSFNDDSLIIGVGGHQTPAGTFVADQVDGARINVTKQGIEVL